MATYKSRALKTGLLNKGFRVYEGDHHFLFLYIGGKKTAVRTRISHGSKEYGDNLLSLVARQLHLTKDELMNLIDCPMTHNEYVATLKRNGHI